MTKQLAPTDAKGTKHMARTSKAVTVKTSNTSVALIDDALTNEVENLKQQIGQPTGARIKVEPSGNFVLPDGLNLGDEIQVAIINFVARNTYYSSPYNPNNMAPPDCYAIGTVRHDLLVPEDDSPNKQSDACATCELNKFGSGSNGVGKACSNRYLVAVLVVDPDNPGAHNAPDAPVYLLDLPPTAIKSFEGAIRHTAGMMGHWAKALYTVTAKPAGTYAKISFGSPEPNRDYAVHFARRDEVHDMLHRKPDFSAPPPKPAGRGRVPAARPPHR